MTMTEAVKNLLLEWDPMAFDEEDSGVVRDFSLASGRVVYRYVPFDIKPVMRIGLPRLVSVNPDDLDDIRFSTDDEFHECMRSSKREEGKLE